MRGSFAASLPILRQIFLCVVDSHRAVRYGGDHLPQLLHTHIARGVYALKARPLRAVRNDIAPWISLNLVPDQGRFRLVACKHKHAEGTPMRCENRFLSGFQISVS